MEKIYLTTTLPYVNAAPHLGFALEIIQADVIARYHSLMGREVIFNTGTDEHGLKIYLKAQEEGVDVQAYVDQKVKNFQNLKEALDLSFTHFIRTTDAHHVAAAQEFWKRCEKDIEKRTYQAKYCVGCELEKTDSELEDGRCPIHPNLEIEMINEENYFFLFSRYQEPLLKLYREHPEFVVPGTRLEEITSFVSQGLKDFSISRLKSKMPWGVEVPGDSEHVMYVWFDALVNYISTLGWPENESHFSEFWPGIQFAGKDNLRQQSAMWQAMLLSAGLPPSKQIMIHGFLTSGGQKMSKSLGNVVNPLEVVERYGVDALRYWVIREANTFEDSDFTWEKFHESYTGNLVNGLGNLASRILKMFTDHQDKIQIGSDDFKDFQTLITETPELRRYFEEYEVSKFADFIWRRIGEIEKYIQETEPFKKIKIIEEQNRAVQDILKLVTELHTVATLVEPILPGTSQKIKLAIREQRMIEPLFPRKELL